MDKVNVGAILMLVVVAVGGLVWSKNVKSEEATYSKPFLAVCSVEQENRDMTELLGKCSMALAKKCPGGVDVQWVKESPPDAIQLYIAMGVRCQAPAQLEGSI